MVEKNRILRIVKQPARDLLNPLLPEVSFIGNHCVDLPVTCFGIFILGWLALPCR